MKIKLTSVHVDNQEEALRFYTEVLGFVKKTDIAAGEYRWLTVVSPEEPEGVELVLEPNDNPAAKAAYQRLPFTHRNEYAKWIDEGKKPETRADRVAKTIKRLTAPR